MNSKKQLLISDICISGVFVALIVVFKLIAFFINYIDISLLILTVCCMFFKRKTSLQIAILSGALSFLILQDWIWGVSYLAANICIWILCISFLKFINLKPAIILFIFVINTLFEYSFYLSIWYLIDAKNAYGMYLTKLLIQESLFTLYLFLPVIVLPSIYTLFNSVKENKPHYFNKYYLLSNRNSIFKAEGGGVLKNDYTKKNYILWNIALTLSMAMFVANFSVLPYILITTLGYKYLLLVIIVPFSMTITTPVWMKVKKKTGNHNLLKINSLLLTISIVITYITFMYTQKPMLITSLTIILLISGMFLAGIIPMTMEVLRSYYKNTNTKSKLAIVTGLPTLFFMPIVFVVAVMFEVWIVAILFAIIGLTIFTIHVFNKNIMTEEITMNITKEQVSEFKTSHKFLYIIHFPAYFIGFGRFFEYCLPLLFFIKFNNNHLTYTFDLSISNVMWLIISLLGLYLAQSIAKLIKSSDQNCYKLYISGMIIFTLGLILITSFFILNYSVLLKQYNLIYYSAIIISQFLIGFGYGLIEKTKGNLNKNIFDKNTLTVSMILDHIMGNSAYNLLINLVLISILSFVDLSNFTIIFVFAIPTIIGLVSLIAASITYKKALRVNI